MESSIVNSRNPRNNMKNTKTNLPISIVIPTYCEEKVLPDLLKSIENQIFSPTEVIVADAQSPDRTREIARLLGARVVEGGKIAFGRNAGAKVAKSEYVLFLDADTQLPTELTLVGAYLEAISKNLDIGTIFYDVIKDKSTTFGVVAGSAINGAFNAVKVVQSFLKYPKWEAGSFVLVKKEFFNKVGGFDEKMTMNEDRDFFQRVVKAGGNYGLITMRINTSVRRFDTPKKVAKGVLWIAAEAVLLGVGVYAGSKLFKKVSSRLYGKLGGGEGKDPSD